MITRVINLTYRDMKKVYFSLILLSISLLAFAQATDLEIDNQTPGWLSSKINYGDQETVQNLKVTGYINETDLKFIGTLVKNRALNGCLDISNTYVVSEKTNGDNCLSSNFLGVTGSATLQKLVLPTSIQEAYSILINSSFINSGRIIVDTLYVNWQLPYIEWQNLGHDAEYHHLFLGENIDSIPNKAFIFASSDYLKSVHFSHDTHYIGNGAFYGSPTYTRILTETNFEELQNLRFVGVEAFKYSAYTPDSLSIPASLTDFDTSTFSYKDGEHIFFSESLKSISCISPDPFITSTRTVYNYPFDKKKVILHFKTMEPPALPSLGNSVTMIVPKGGKSAYQKVTSANIIEENPIESISVSPSNLFLEKGETSVLAASPIPSNADNKDICWISGDENVATVSSEGKVCAINFGQTYVYATAVADENVKDSCLVTVIQHVEGISIEPQELRFDNIGQTHQLTVLITPSNATNKDVTWNSSNSDVCTVTETGYVVAVGYGQATISAVSKDGKIPATCIVLVKKREVPASAIVWEESEFVYSGLAPQPKWKNTYSEYSVTVKMPVLNKDVGTWEAVIPFTFKDDVDEIITNVPYTYTIYPAPLGIRVSDAHKQYGGENPSFEYEYVGWVNNENENVLIKKPVIQTSASKSSPVGTYPIEVSGAAAKNYEISYQQGTLNIGKRRLTVSTKDYTRTYGEENPEFELLYSGFVNDENEGVLQTNPQATTEATTHSDTGVYPIDIAGGEALNYDFNYIAGRLTVEKAYQTLEWEQDFSSVGQYAQVELTATSSSGLEVTYSVEGDDICAIEKVGNTYYLDCFGSGEAVIVAQQEGNQNYWQTTKMYRHIKIIPTAVNDLDAQSDKVEAIYDANGRKLSKPQRGVNILLMRDGTKRKMVVK